MPSMKYGANSQQNNSSGVKSFSRPSSKDKDTPVNEGEDILAKYKKLYLQNEDMVGWIAIDGMSINYPVMQSKNNPNFYLKHSFEKEYSDLGVPYIQEDCDILTSDNLVIYGHHIKGGSDELIPIFSGHARIIQGKFLTLPDKGIKI